MGDGLPKTARLMTVEQVVESFFASEAVEAVDVCPRIPVPNDEEWDTFSAVIEIERPTGDRLRRRAYFGKVHPHFRAGTALRGRPLPFWMMTVTLYRVDADDVPVGSVIFADETVVARLRPRAGSSS
jgi:hypothetical protein